MGWLVLLALLLANSEPTAQTGETGGRFNEEKSSLNEFESFESLEIKDTNLRPQLLQQQQPQASRTSRRQEVEQLREARDLVDRLALLRAIEGAVRQGERGGPPAPRARRTMGGLMGGLSSNAMDRLSVIESLLDDGNASRAYKPKTISTARGFGKRSPH